MTKLINENLNTLVSGLKQSIKSNKNDFIDAVLVGNKPIDDEFVGVKSDESDLFLQSNSRIYESDTISQKVDSDEYEKNYFSEKMEDMKVLIFSTNQVNIEMLVFLMEDWNVNIRSCSKLDEVDVLIKEEKFDLLIINDFYSHAVGKNVVLKKNSSRLNADIPVVFFTETLDLLEKIRIHRLGIELYIEKPCEISLIKVQIYNLLKRLRKIKVKNQEREDYFAAVTHDIKGPILSDFLALKMLVTTEQIKLNPFYDNMVCNMIGSLTTVKSILENMLCKYKDDAGVFKIVKSSMDFKALIEGCINDLKYSAMAKNQKIKFNCYTEDTIIMGDDIELRRVIYNLISNALEYSPENADIKLKLSKMGKDLHFEIEDNGIGISDTRNVFEKYISNAKKEKKIGFGLGLYICKRIVDSHGGQINIESKVGKGTKVYFTIPVN